MSDDEPKAEPPAPTDPSEPTELSETGRPSGGLWEKLKDRRITQLVIAYLAGGWIALTGVDQLVDRQVLPEVVYRISLLLFLGGLGIALILGWYHGEKGRQKVTLSEVVLLVIVSLGTLALSLVTASRFAESERIETAGRGLGLGPDARRVAVLYFQELDANGGLSFLADGLTEALIDELGRIPELDVISRNGVAPFRDGNAAPDSVARALNAGSVIDGSVETTRGGLRVNVSLLDGMSGAAIDRTAFTVPAEDLLAVRDSVVQMAGQFLRARIGEEVRVREQRREAETVEGWTLVQRAERLRKEAEDAARHDPARAIALLASADSLLRAAEAIEPNWGAPSARRADLALRRGVWTHSMAERLEAIETGVAHANRALERESRNARALEARGNLYRFHHWLNVSPTDAERTELLDRAERDLRAAVEANPGLASAHATLSRLYYDRKDRVSAALAAREALRADAYLSDAEQVLDRLFWAHYDLGQFTEARRACQDGSGRFPTDPRFVRCRLWVMLAPAGERDPDLAWDLVARADSLTPAAERDFQGRVHRMIMGGILARAGLPDSARNVLAEARGGPEVDPDQNLLGYEAISRTVLGDHDVAVQHLRRYITANPDHVDGFVEVEGDLHWWWRPLRSHPDFSGMLRPGM